MPSYARDLVQGVLGAVLVGALALGCGSTTSPAGVDAQPGHDATQPNPGDDRPMANPGNDVAMIDDVSVADGGELPDLVVANDVSAPDVIDPMNVCAQDCSGRVCGPTGPNCDQTCGSCPDGQSCGDDGTCTMGCTPDCTMKACGNDGCGGSCGDCAGGDNCNDAGQCIAGCVPQCSGRGCGDDGCGATCGSCDAGQSCNGTGQCVCPTPVEVVIYNSEAWNYLADAFAQDPSPCGQYYLSIPATADEAGDKTFPRQGEAEAMRARGPRMHAMAEFHWTSWSHKTTLSWYDKGVEFRQRMIDRGYDVSANDTWAINELPSSVRTSDTTRTQVRDVVRGLHDGPPGSPPAKGAVFIVGLGHGTVNVGPYRDNLEAWLSDSPFWVDMNSDVRWWAEEVYTDPTYTCVGGTTVAVRSGDINEYVEHVARLAAANPGVADTAQSYLSRAYVPLMNAVFNSPASRGYGNTVIPLIQMEHHVSGQVYAARSWATDHTYPDGRIGFGWDRAPGTQDSDLDTLAKRLASAIHYAYDADGGSAAGACSPSGAFTYCQCNVPGAGFNTAWSALGTW